MNQDKAQMIKQMRMKQQEVGPSKESERRTMIQLEVGLSKELEKKVTKVLGQEIMMILMN